jgi:hypothetical protein
MELDRRGWTCQGIDHSHKIACIQLGVSDIRRPGVAGQQRVYSSRPKSPWSLLAIYKEQILFCIFLKQEHNISLLLQPLASLPLHRLPTIFQSHSVFHTRLRRRCPWQQLLWVPF